MKSLPQTRISNIILLAVMSLFIACGNTSDTDKDHEQEPAALTGDYVGQEPPGAMPSLFAPNYISTGMYERDVTMTPDGNEFYFGLMSGAYVTIVMTKRVDDVWTPLEIAPFCSDPNYYNLEPHITPDGQRILFLSTRPTQGQEPKSGWAYQDIWAANRTADGWGEPYNVGPPVNTDQPEFYPSVTRDGTIYFTREVTEEGKQRSLIFRSRMVDGQYSEANALPDEVNPGDQQYNAFIDPDERYLIVCMAGREDNIGRSDYYVCFRYADDSWTGPINMGAEVNTPGNNAPSPYVSPDGKYFFFASNRKSPEGSMAAQWGYDKILQMSIYPQNGNADIYWMHASFIDRLRP
ncbi:MAG: hypothetical protein ABIA59_07970 [Candidatus Latescibacterota bacterium]